MKDEDLDLLLSEYRHENPSDLKIQKWKNAVRKEILVSQPRLQIMWTQMLAASIIGFVFGALVVGTIAKTRGPRLFVENNYDNATIEYIYTKND